MALYETSRDVNRRAAGIEGINVEALFCRKRNICFWAAIEDTENGDATICSDGVACRLRCIAFAVFRH
jgi:hypothetical protein